MKLNPEYRLFDGNMFAQMRALLADQAPPSGRALLDLSIGEPQIAGGSLLTKSLAEHNDGWQFYPKAAGHPRFTAAVEHYIARRWPAAAGLVDLDRQMLPVPGTREPLAFLGGLVKGAKPDAAVLIANPYYHAWRAGALASGAEMRYLNAFAADGFIADLAAQPVDVLSRTSLVYLCSPTNPQGGVMSRAQIKSAIRLARQHDFLLVMDECYCDIWRGAPPAGALEAAAEIHDEDGADPQMDPLRNLMVLNSLSKRSSAAGLRAGFIIGDAAVVGLYAKLVANSGSLVPTPLLMVAADLYEDEDHVAAIRAHYDHSFALAAHYLGVTPPQGGFFLWLPVGDDQDFVKRLMREQAVRAMPGSFMAETSDGVNPGAGYVRLALVHDHDQTEESLARVAAIHDSRTGTAQAG
ncbi:MAG: aminotransferase class I/II-fold pyridoxal phosphate-dependent enzyme [Pseudomonadota bacterium]|nr:aminotransferase class I/II-fold pyridoxal phosphate-dependent enzyme [Pseudomonadota bacterium]